jgi:predicted protein tyrosine phosphatase
VAAAPSTRHASKSSQSVCVLTSLSGVGELIQGKALLYHCYEHVSQQRAIAKRAALTRLADGLNALARLTQQSNKLASLFI